MADMEADIKAEDRDEHTALMEPLLLAPRHREPLTDLALDLTQKSAAFRASLPAGILNSLADLVRAMNCYYSNLIEGITPTQSTSSGRCETSTALTRISATCNSKPRLISLSSAGSTAED